MKHIILNTLTLLFIIGCAGTAMGEKSKGNMDENISPSDKPKSTSEIIGITPTSVVTPTPTSVVTPTPTSVVTPTPTPIVTLTPDEKMQKLSKEIEILLSPNTQDLDKAYTKLEEITSICGDKQNHVCAISYKNKGKIEKYKGQYSKAIMGYEKAIEYGLEDSNGTLLEEIANIYYVNLQKIPEAIQKLEEVAKNPNRKNDSKLYYDIGALYIEQGEANYKKAKDNIFIAKQLGNRDAEHLWFKYDLYKY